MLNVIINYLLTFLMSFETTFQGRNHMKNLGATSAMVGRICPPGCNRVKVSQNLGATAVAPVAPVDTSLLNYIILKVS